MRKRCYVCGGKADRHELNYRHVRCDNGKFFDVRCHDSCERWLVGEWVKEAKERLEWYTTDRCYVCGKSIGQYHNHQHSHNVRLPNGDRIVVAGHDPCETWVIEKSLKDLKEVRDWTNLHDENKRNMAIAYSVGVIIGALCMLVLLMCDRGGRMRKLNVFGAEVYAPVCGKCSMNDYVIVREMPSSWCYWCTKCDRCIPFEEFMEGNP